MTSRRARLVLWGPWLVIAVAWPATLLGWYYISLAADPSWLRDRFLLNYLVALLVADSALCVGVLAWAVRQARAILRVTRPTLDEARAAWHEALRLPQRAAWLIVGLIALTAFPVTAYLLWLGEGALILHGWTAALIVGVCELTLLFPLIQATTLPFLRRLKALYPELRLREEGAPRPPQRAYFALALLATALVAIVLVARLIYLRGVPHQPDVFPESAAIILTTLCFLTMFGGIALQLYLSVLLPLRALAGAMTRFSAGQTVEPLGLPHVGEIGVLAEHFDDMVAALTRSRASIEEREALLRHAQRFDAMGLMAASFVHEMANPLAGVRMNLKVVADMIGEEAGRQAAPGMLSQAGELLQGMREATAQIGAVLGDFKSFGRRDGEECELCDIAAVLDMAIRIVGVELRRAGGVERAYGPVPPVLGNAHKLTQVFVNLLLNAAQAMRPGVTGKIRVGVGMVDGTVHAWVSDNGMGMAQEDLDKLFTALYNRKKGQGSGLGLYVSRQIVEAHGGRIECVSREGEGSTFRVILPTRPPSCAD
jgi:signal transduction histidine kinase